MCTVKNSWWWSRIRIELVPSWSCSQAVSKPVWHIPLLCVQWKTPDDGQRNCPKHVQFHSINKFVKLVHLVGFIVRNTWPSSERYKQDYSYNYRSVRTIQFVVINSTVYIAIYLFGWWVTTRLFCAHHPLETAWCTSQQFTTRLFCAHHPLETAWCTSQQF